MNHDKNQNSAPPADLRTFRKRVALLVDEVGLETLAKRSKLNESSIRRYMRGREPTVKHLVNLAHAGNVSVNWLATGLGARRPTLEGVTLSESCVLLSPIRADGIKPTMCALGFEEEWLARLGVEDPTTVRLHPVMDDSMEGTVAQGDLVLLDRAQRQQRDGVFVLVSGEREPDMESDPKLSFIRRLHVTPRGIMVSSDNQRYGDKSTLLDHNLQVVGRVLVALRAQLL